MIRVLMSSIANIMLELATVLISVGILLLVGSGYLVARFVGVNVHTNRVATLIKVGRDLIAMGVDAKRRVNTADTDPST